MQIVWTAWTLTSCSVTCGIGLIQGTRDCIQIDLTENCTESGKHKIESCNHGPCDCKCNILMKIFQLFASFSSKVWTTWTLGFCEETQAN